MNCTGEESSFPRHDLHHALWALREGLRVEDIHHVGTDRPEAVGQDENAHRN